MPETVEVSFSGALLRDPDHLPARGREPDGGRDGGKASQVPSVHHGRAYSSSSGRYRDPGPERTEEEGSRALRGPSPRQGPDSSGLDRPLDALEDATPNAPLAQLDRATASGAVGQRFESSVARWRFRDADRSRRGPVSDVALGTTEGLATTKAGSHRLRQTERPAARAEPASRRGAGARPIGLDHAGQGPRTLLASRGTRATR